MTEINSYFLIDTSNQSLMQNASRALCESAAIEVFKFLTVKGVPVDKSHIDEFLGGLSSPPQSVAISGTGIKKLCSGRTIKGEGCKSCPVKGTDRCKRHTVTMASAASSSVSGSIAASASGAWTSKVLADQVSAAAPLVGSAPSRPLFSGLMSTGASPLFAAFPGAAATPPAVTAPAVTAPAVTAPAVTAPAVTPPAVTALEAPLEFASGPVPVVDDDELNKALITD